MLGLITHINEMLQEVHGKIPMSAKQKILRSLGAVVSLIGSPISTVAPQVGRATFFIFLLCLEVITDNGDLPDHGECRRPV